MTHPFTPADIQQATAEGWGLFEVVGFDGYEIQRDDEAGVFETDDAAVTYVKEQARRVGSPSSIYSRALTYHLGKE